MLELDARPTIYASGDGDDHAPVAISFMGYFTVVSAHADYNTGMAAKDVPSIFVISIETYDTTVVMTDD